MRVILSDRSDKIQIKMTQHPVIQENRKKNGKNCKEILAIFILILWDA